MTAYLQKRCLKANNFDVLGYVFHCLLVAALENLGSYFDIEFERRFQAKLVQHFLSLSEQPLDIYLVCCIIKKKS